MIKIKNVQKEISKTVDIIQRQSKKIEFEFEIPKTKDTRTLPVAIYFDYIKTRDTKEMLKINVGNFYNPIFVDQDSRVFWNKIYNDIEKEIRNGFGFIPKREQLEIIGKVYTTIKQVVEVEEEILLVSL